MGFRAAFAALIAVVLLSASCLASACETSCTLNALGTGCHHAGATASASNHPVTHSAIRMSAMQHCGMPAASSSEKSPTCDTVAAASSCKHLLCEQPLQSFASDNESSAAYVATVQPALTAPVFAFPSPLQPSRGPASKPPLSRAPLLVSLQTLLRV